MSSESTSQSSPGGSSSDTPTWTYPTRFCRICREDVVPTVTMYPPGIPLRFQRPIVEYKNEDEYGRLIKPCKCTGSMRYIHELCLRRSRTENRREGSMWRCHTCGYRFNFQRLAFERFLSSKYSSGVLTVLAMITIMFFLGFIADPIINMYADPYQSLLGDQGVWDEVSMRVKVPGPRFLASWVQHFLKGLISMGLVGFLKSVLLNPLNWLNLRHNLGMTSARTSTTGRDRAINISWIAVVIGMVSAFYFFYQWVQTVIQLSLRKVGNNIVDTQLPGDDDDLKPPSGWKAPSQQVPAPNSSNAETAPETADAFFQTASSFVRNRDAPARTSSEQLNDTSRRERAAATSEDNLESSPVLVGSWPDGLDDTGRSSALDSAHDQEWSFASL